MGTMMSKKSYISKKAAENAGFKAGKAVIAVEQTPKGRWVYIY